MVPPEDAANWRGELRQVVGRGRRVSDESRVQSNDDLIIVRSPTVDDGETDQRKRRSPMTMDALLQVVGVQWPVVFSLPRRSGFRVVATIPPGDGE